MNEGKHRCHLIMSSNDFNEIKIGNTLIKRSNCEKLLGAKIDIKLTFDDYIEDLCRKANDKLGAPGRVNSYIGLAKKNLVINSFFVAHLN